MASVDFLKIPMSAINGTVQHFDEQMRATRKHSNKDIDPTRSNLNYNISNFGDGKENWQSIMQHACGRIILLDEQFPPERVRQDRKEAVYLYTPCPQSVEAQGREDEFFAAAFELQKKWFGDNLIGMQVHKDEKHMYLDGGEKKESLYHSHSLIVAYAEWEDKQGNKRRGINSKHFNTKQMYATFQQAMQKMVQERFLVSYQTGNYVRKGKTVEELKWDSERELFAAKLAEAERLLDDKQKELTRERELFESFKKKKKQQLKELVDDFKAEFQKAYDEFERERVIQKFQYELEEEIQEIEDEKNIYGDEDELDDLD